jgi:hypothetical protein
LSAWRSCISREDAKKKTRREEKFWRAIGAPIFTLRALFTFASSRETGRAATREDYPRRARTMRRAHSIRRLRNPLLIGPDSERAIRSLSPIADSRDRVDGGSVSGAVIAGGSDVITAARAGPIETRWDVSIAGAASLLRARTLAERISISLRSRVSAV